MRTEILDGQTVTNVILASEEFAEQQHPRQVATTRQVHVNVATTVHPVVAVECPPPIGFARLLGIRNHAPHET